MTATEEAYEELAKQFKALQRINVEQAANFEVERDSLAAEVASLRSALQEAESVAGTDQERVDALERELRATRARMTSDAVAHRILEAHNAGLLEDAKKHQSALAGALANATDQARRADKAEQEAEYKDIANQERLYAQEQELQAARAQITSDAKIRQILEARNVGLLEDAEKHRSALADALTPGATEYFLVEEILC